MSVNWRVAGGLAVPNWHRRTVNTLMHAASQSGPRSQELHSQSLNHIPKHHFNISPSLLIQLCSICLWEGLPNTVTCWRLTLFITVKQGALSCMMSFIGWKATHRKTHKHTSAVDCCSTVLRYMYFPQSMLLYTSSCLHFWRCAHLVAAHYC